MPTRMNEESKQGIKLHWTAVYLSMQTGLP